MKYLLMICGDESRKLSADDIAFLVKGTDAWVTEMDGRGVRLQGDRLRPAADGRTARVRGGAVLVTDGPFAETTEQIAGYDIIECASLDEAVEVATKHPMASFGAVEVRPFWDE